MAAIRAI